MPEPYRAAVYYAPEASDPLWNLGCIWLGRDPETGRAIAQPPLPQAGDLAPLTAEPRRYGFHATLKAPMRLRQGLANFLQAVEKLAERQSGFVLPPLAVTRLDGFLALCLTETCLQMQALAAACVTGLDDQRLPEAPAEQARRATGRTAAQQENIARWGYPLVLNEFQFHMTLTNNLDNNPLASQAAAFFAPALGVPRRVASLAVFIEAEPGAPFTLLRRLHLQG